MKAFLSFLLALLQFGFIGLFGASDKSTGNVEKNVDNYNYVIGTQAICPSYKFTKQSDLSELGGRILAMGSNMIKIETGDTAVHKLLDEYGDQFKYVFMWYRKYNLHQAVFYDGLSEEEKQEDYDACYNFAKTLLEKYNDSGIEFYIGNWETDWYYINGYDVNVKNVDDTVTQAMIEWINNRQKAIDDAKRDTEYTNVEVWGYLEVNRTQDAFEKNYDRVVNKVLPYANVDYVSYSSYDCQKLSANKIKKTIDKINKLIPAKDNIPGSRVFIGEFARPASEFNYDDKAYTKANLEILSKYLRCNVKFILFWQMYCNEKPADGRCKGYWLVDDQGNETALYKTVQSMLSNGHAYVEKYQQKHNGKLPSEAKYRAYLRTLPELYSLK